LNTKDVGITKMLGDDPLDFLYRQFEVISKAIFGLNFRPPAKFVLGHWHSFIILPCPTVGYPVGI